MHNFLWDSSQNLEKINDTIPRKHPYSQKNGRRKDGQGWNDPTL